MVGSGGFGLGMGLQFLGGCVWVHEVFPAGDVDAEGGGEFLDERLVAGGTEAFPFGISISSLGGPLASLR